MEIYDFVVVDNAGNNVSLQDYKGKVLLIVNTATKCGFTPQYEELEALYEKYNKEGFEILDFPCNQFFGQAPGDAKEIESFCKLRFGTKFKQFAKIDVNGKNASPLYVYLKGVAPGNNGKKIPWNFTKFLIDRNGNVTNIFNPTEKPMSFENKIKELL